MGWSRPRRLKKIFHGGQKRGRAKGASPAGLSARLQRIELRVVAALYEAITRGAASGEKRLASPAADARRTLTEYKRRI